LVIYHALAVFADDYLFNHSQTTRCGLHTFKSEVEAVLLLSPPPPAVSVCVLSRILRNRSQTDIYQAYLNNHIGMGMDSGDQAQDILSRASIVQKSTNFSHRRRLYGEQEATRRTLAAYINFNLQIWSRGYAWRATRPANNSLQNVSFVERGIWPVAGQF